MTDRIINNKQRDGHHWGEVGRRGSYIGGTPVSNKKKISDDIRFLDLVTDIVHEFIQMVFLTIQYTLGVQTPSKKSVSLIMTRQTGTTVCVSVSYRRYPMIDLSSVLKSKR